MQRILVAGTVVVLGAAVISSKSATEKARVAGDSLAKATDDVSDAVATGLRDARQRVDDKKDAAAKKTE